MNVNWKEIFPGVPTTAEEAQHRLCDERTKMNRQKAIRMMENSTKEWDLKIQDPELRYGDNQTLEILGSCYLHGFYCGLYLIIIALKQKKAKGEPIDIDLSGFLTTEKAIDDQMQRERQYIEEPNEMREIFNTAATTWKVRYVGSKATDYNKTLENAVSCYLYGLNAAFDQILIAMGVDPA